MSNMEFGKLAKCKESEMKPVQDTESFVLDAWQ